MTGNLQNIDICHEISTSSNKKIEFCYGQFVEQDNMRKPKGASRFLIVS